MQSAPLHRDRLPIESERDREREIKAVESSLYRHWRWVREWERERERDIRADLYSLITCNFNISPVLSTFGLKNALKQGKC